MSSAEMPSWNLATRSPAERRDVTADLIACRIRHQLRGLKNATRQAEGKKLLAAVPAHLQEAVVEHLKARSSG